MSIDAMRSRLDAYWEIVDRDARDRKDPILALERVRDLYRRLDPEERGFADRVLAEWALSDSEAKRFDAIALIGELRVTAARPALRELADRLARHDDPGAPFERRKVEALIEDLGPDGERGPERGS